MMGDTMLEQLETLLRNSTPGEWQFHGSSDNYMEMTTENPNTTVIGASDYGVVISQNDANFIVNAHALLGELIASYRNLESQNRTRALEYLTAKLAPFGVTVWLNEYYPEKLHYQKGTLYNECRFASEKSGGYLDALAETIIEALTRSGAFEASE